MKVENKLSVVWNAIINKKIVKSGEGRRKWTLPNDGVWVGNVKTFYNRECYDYNIKRFFQMPTTVTKGLLSGTAGIGKSLFLIRLLDYIVEFSETVADISIDYYQREGPSTSCRYRLLGSGDVVLYDQLKHRTPDYLLSDSIDFGVDKGNRFSLLVASEKEADVARVTKRVREMGANGASIIMPPFTMNELLQIKPLEMTEEEAIFRGDVFGGSARNFVANTAGTGTYTYQVVDETMNAFFPEIYKVRFASSWQNIVSSLSQQLGKMTSISDNLSAVNIVNSMFIHIIPDKGAIWASVFMKTLAGAVVDAKDINITGELKKILGNSGYGSLFESVCHLKLTRCVTPFLLIPLHARNGKNIQETANPSIKFDMDIAILTTVSDISSLPNNTYGLPLFSNFPLVDAIIQPDTLIQYTVSLSHKGAVNQLADIRKKLNEKNSKKHLIIFVVPKDNLFKFKHQNNLYGIKQFVITDSPQVETGTSKKRKA